MPVKPKEGLKRRVIWVTPADEAKIANIQEAYGQRYPMDAIRYALGITNAVAMDMLRRMGKKVRG